MMTQPRLLPLKWLGALTSAVALAAVASAQPAPGSLEDQQVRVQITEVSLLRTQLLIDTNTTELTDRVLQALVDRDFEVYTDAQEVSGIVTSAQMRAAGEPEDAQLVVYAKVADEPDSERSGLKVYRATATVQVYSRLTGQPLVSKTVEALGARTAQDSRARRTAREKAIDQAAQQAIEGSLAKAHRILVHRAVIVNVFSESALLAIMEYMGKMEGVYHVKRVSFDRQTNEALIEVIGAPRSQTFWRAYLEKLPKTKVNVQVTPNDKLHNKYPDWFLPPVR